MITLGFGSFALMGGALQGFFLCAALFTRQRGNARESFARSARCGNGFVLHEYLAIRGGLYLTGRYLMALFIHKKSSAALVISARDMTKQELKSHGENK